MRRFRTYSQVHEASADLLEQVGAQAERVRARLARVACVVAVASGKGGVGKSALTANLAAALAAEGLSVGALDADVNGPTLARMLGARAGSLRVTADGVEPATGAGGVRVISMDLLLEGDETPVRWREPAQGGFIWQGALETGALREFLADTAWGELDMLLIDLPPGTEKIGRLLELVRRPDALLLVSTPSRAAEFVVAKSLRYAREAGVGAVGVVRNMTAAVCAACGTAVPLFERSGPAWTPDELWGDVPFDPRLAESTDAGEPFVLTEPEAPASRAIARLALRLRALPQPQPQPQPQPHP
ncbi:MAG: P-loop NTPase [Longimicrobiales bacterium]